MGSPSRTTNSTTIGFNDDEIMLMTVDGRQPGWSIGMRYEDLAVFMKEWGMKEALNLDGGGSTTAIVRDVVENRPSDGGLRRNANGVIVVSEVEQGPAVLYGMLRYRGLRFAHPWLL